MGARRARPGGASGVMDARVPSRTAQYMALFRALESVQPSERRLVEDRAAVRFLDLRLRAVVCAARLAPLRSLLIAFIDRRWPGPRLSGVVRTRVIDDLIQGALRDGATQLVLLGAGYDTRASRLCAAASATVFEVDHPATQRRKRMALGSTPDQVRYVPVDFERDALAQALSDAGLDRAGRSCVLWEGVFSYLTSEAIDQTLAAVVEMCAPGSSLILTYVDQRALDERRSSRNNAWLAAVGEVGEPFLSGLDPAQAPAFFAARHLELCSDESTADAARRLGVAGAQGIPGFYRLASLRVGGRSATIDGPAIRGESKTC
jgi:methyltransferase (TIGR00027 family)